MEPLKFVNEAYSELRKSSWMARAQAMGSTVVVLALVAIMAVFVSSIDFILSVILGALLGR